MFLQNFILCELKNNNLILGTGLMGGGGIDGAHNSEWTRALTAKLAAVLTGCYLNYNTGVFDLIQDINFSTIWKSALFERWSTS